MQGLRLFQFLEHDPPVGEVQALIGPEFLHLSQYGVVSMQYGFVAGEQIAVKGRDSLDIPVARRSTPCRSSVDLQSALLGNFIMLRDTAFYFFAKKRQAQSFSILGTQIMTIITQMNAS